MGHGAEEKDPTKPQVRLGTANVHRVRIIFLSDRSSQCKVATETNIGAGNSHKFFFF